MEGVGMSAEEPPIELDFEPVEDLDGEKLVEQQSELVQQLWDSYQPHVHDWHEKVQMRQTKVWQEIRDRAETEEPECPECDSRHWGQSPGDPAYCSCCGYEAPGEVEEEIHEAWDAMREEVKASG